MPMHDPALGRYIESDPIGLQGGVNTFAYGLQNPLEYIDPDGLVVKVVAQNAQEADELMKAYARINRTAKGRAITGRLERSAEVCEIRPIHHDAFYCPRNTTDPKCQGKKHTVFIDPNNAISVPTTRGMQPSPLEVTLGHELGHANGERDDGPGAMNNVNTNENPIRAGLGLPARTEYYVPSIIWTPRR